MDNCEFIKMKSNSFSNQIKPIIKLTQIFAQLQQQTFVQIYTQLNYQQSNMQGDQLLQKWKRAKQICQKIIQISKNANLHNKISQSPMQKQTSREYLSVYDTVYQLCITKEKQQTRVTMVYKDFKDILKNALLSMCQQLIKEKDIYKLAYLRKIWQAYCDILKRMMHMFAYLNRPFHIKQGRIEQLQKSGMGIIVVTLLNQVSIAEYEGIYFREIDRIRKTNDFSNAQTLKDMVDMLYKIHLKLIKNISKKAITRYTQFYSRFLKNAREFYQKKYSTIKQLHPAEYFQQVNKIYTNEVKIASQCFGIGGQSVINKQFSQEFIQKYRKILMQSPKGLKSIMHHQQIHTLKIIIEMYSKLTRNIDGFKEQFQEYIFEDIKKHIEEIKNQLLIKRNAASVYCHFMARIIQKNIYYLEMLEQSFMHIGDFVAYYKAGVEKAFIAVKLPVPIEEILAMYIDYKMKFNSVEETDIEEVIKNVMNIFVCIENKDFFLIKYTQKLAKKLLTVTPETVKNHELFVQSLKLNCGIKFTERVETLLYEYNLHEEYTSIIKDILVQRKVTVDFNVRIFSEGAWPTSNIMQIPLHYFPQSIQQANQCLMVYNSEHSSKKKFKISFLESKFRWVYHFDKEVENKLAECYFDTNCCQGAMLWLIYGKRPERVSVKVIEHYFEKVPLKVIKENLNKMTDLNENILIRETVADQLFYSFNLKMKSAKRLITYQTGVSSQQEKLFQQQDLGKDREIVLDANIAKFMKSRKVTDFQTLFIQITKMIKTFNAQIKDIKIAVERLIGKELLQRDQKDVTKIRYVD